MSALRFKAMQPLFYSPLAMFELDDAQTLNAQLLVEIEVRRNNSPGLDRSNWQGWHSKDDFFERSEPACLALRSHMLEAVRVCTGNVSPNFDFTRYGIQAEGWINVMGRGGFNTPHDHPAWVWSGCYYVNVPESDKEMSGNIEFFDTRTNLRTLTVEGAACFASKLTVKPRSGMILVFPSYLRHWVYPNESDQDRVTIAFNARFIRTANP
jgi:uncharacterized protein (TIGR02466 family)